MEFDTRDELIAEWQAIREQDERRRVQNRVAQRRFRARNKSRRRAVFEHAHGCSGEAQDEMESSITSIEQPEEEEGSTKHDACYFLGNSTTHWAPEAHRVEEQLFLDLPDFSALDLSQPLDSPSSSSYLDYGISPLGSLPSLFQPATFREHSATRNIHRTEESSRSESKSPCAYLTPGSTHSPLHNHFNESWALREHSRGPQLQRSGNRTSKSPDPLLEKQAAHLSSKIKQLMRMVIETYEFGVVLEVFGPEREVQQMLHTTMERLKGLR